MKNKITVAEALEKLKAKEPLGNFQIDFSNDEVEALDAMQLAKAGVEVPEDSIYYKDEATAEDKSFDGDWAEVATDEMDRLWEEQGWSTATMEEWFKEHTRTRKKQK